MGGNIRVALNATLLIKLLLFLFCNNVSAQQAGNFERISLATINPDAVCNDGSSAMYFYYNL